jgi:hypothetical protein
MRHHSEPVLSMKRIGRKRFTVRRLLGLGAMVLGLLVLLAPIFTGR